MNGVDVASPWWLMIVAVAIPLILLGRKGSLAAMTGAQRTWTLLARIALVAAASLALADLRIFVASKEATVLLLVDQSASISPAAAEEAQAFITQAIQSKPAGTVIGVAGFATEGEVIQPLSTSVVGFPTPNAEALGNATDIGHALDFAAAILPPHGLRRVVLLSDGNDTSGNALNAAARLARSGIELWSVPLRNDTTPEVLVESLDVPPRLKLGEPFDLTARIRSSRETTATVKLYENQFLIEQREITLALGSNEFKATNLEVEGSFVSYEVEVSATEDTQIENNRATATASLRGEPRVLLVESDQQQARTLATALRGSRIAVEVRGSKGSPRTLEDLQQFDLFLLSDVPALQLSRQQMELYRQWVQDFGGGFAMLGGENSYGVGGYYRTPIEQMLPVRMEHDDRQDTPSVALLVILDRSGSMTAQVQGQTKMSLANQGAVFAMNALQPKDHFGVLAVDTRAHTVTPLAPLNDRSAAEQKITSITAGGGGIYLYTSLSEALQVLRDVPARIKHVILFSDAADAEEKVAGEIGDARGTAAGGSALDLASAMLSARITTSVVALGSEQDKDTAFLRQLSERGNGRFYLTSDATTLPQIFSTETMKVAQSSIVEEPFLAIAVANSPLTAGIEWQNSPLLLGYNATKCKPTADVVLSTERGEPLLAVWRYGLGHAAAFTSDAKGRWASEWQQWPGYGRFWTQVVRGLLRKSDQALLQVSSREEAGKLKVEVNAITPSGTFRNALAIQVAARFPDGQSQLTTARQESPGRYGVSFDLPDTGTTILSVTSPDLPDGGTVLGHTRKYPIEYLMTSVNEALLRNLSLEPDRYSPAPRDVFLPAMRAHPQPLYLSPFFLVAALFLVPVDIWLRRRTWTPRNRVS
jgi:Ca-activated chloride channel family protein